MLWDLEKKPAQFAHTSQKVFNFSSKMSEHLIHIQHTQPFGGAKWDALFLRIIKHAPSILHPNI